MSTEKIKNLLGDRVEILEMTIKNVDNQLQLLLKTDNTRGRFYCVGPTARLSNIILRVVKFA
ncbi:MAG: hypothetical protein E7531_01260 [Ruminococcaceae bacterium]|nr:hypothetical protein [Oscillospiraceae bacterium]